MLMRRSSPSPDALFGRAVRVVLVAGLLVGSLLAISPGAAAQADSDSDELVAEDELVWYGTDPLAWDTDGDGIGDGDEVYAGLDPLGWDWVNSDGDGLVDSDEVGIYGTDPLAWDTDGDGTSDGAEVLPETDPSLAEFAL